jgi:hypothetical protein
MSRTELAGDDTPSKRSSDPVNPEEASCCYNPTHTGIPIVHLESHADVFAGSYLSVGREDGRFGEPRIGNGRRRKKDLPHIDPSRPVLVSSVVSTLVSVSI